MIRLHAGAYEVKVYDPAIKSKRYIGRFATRELAEGAEERAKQHFSAKPPSVDWFDRLKALETPATTGVPDAALVYFIQGEAGGPIKIGISIDPIGRLAELQAASPSKLRIRKTIPGGRQKEHELHVRFRAQRLWGEWFSPSPELLKLAQGVESPNEHLVSLDLLRRQRQALVQRVAELERAMYAARAHLDVSPSLPLPEPQPRAGADDDRAQSA